MTLINFYYFEGNKSKIDIFINSFFFRLKVYKLYNLNYLISF